jgi:hypothetical protein
LSFGFGYETKILIIQWTIEISCFGQLTQSVYPWVLFLFFGGGVGEILLIIGIPAKEIFYV